MEKSDAMFGGEPSGHVIFRKVASAGDGILTALEILHLIRAEGRALHELAADLERWPQVIRNVKAPRRGEWSTTPAFADAVREAETQLTGSGRIVVRPSGTEPVLRIMVEARDASVASSTAQRLEDIAMRELV